MPQLSPMQQHQMRVNAAQAGDTAALSEQQRALKWLHTQRALLSGIQSRQEREAHKARVMPEIEPYLQGALAADAGQPDPVLTYCTVWALDAGLWRLALDLGRYAVRHGLPMPDEFQRNAPTLLADLMADAALIGRIPAADAPALLEQTLNIIEGANMPDQARAKTHKAIAYGLAGKTTLAGQPGDWASLSAATLELALHHLIAAEKLDPNCGVKKDIAMTRKLLGQKEPAPAPDAEADTPPAPRTRAARKMTAKPRH